MNDLESENKKLKRKLTAMEQKVSQFNAIKEKYDTLIKKFEEKDRRLQEMNFKLEELVRQRTHELEEMNKTLQENLKLFEELSMRDGLTELRNRRSFEDIFNREFNRSKRQNYNFNFFIIDVDNFKKYNDNYGHQLGDEALKMISNILLSTSQRANDYVFRFGGEEFIYISCFLNKRETIKLANLIKQRIEEKRFEHKFNDASEYLTVSIGASVVTHDEEYDKERVFELTDEALYRAKKLGRNRVECISL